MSKYYMLREVHNYEHIYVTLFLAHIILVLFHISQDFIGLVMRMPKLSQ